MFDALTRLLLRLRRKAGLALGSAIIVLLFGGLYDWESRGLGSSSSDSLGPLMRGEYLGHDMLAQRGRKVPVRSDILFLGYDEDSLRLDALWPEEIEGSPALKAISLTQGYWPWPRSVQAMILDKLVAAGARVVAFDLLFEGPSADDSVWKAALDAHATQVVIGENYNFSERTIGSPPRTLIPPGPSPDPRVGFVNYVADHDGRVRYMVFESTPGDAARAADSVIYESFITKILRQLGRADSIPPNSLDRLYPFRFSDPYRSRSVYEIFSDQLWQQNFHNGADVKDKIVLIGPMAGSMHDFHDTPLGRMPGPALHLNVLSAALSHEFLHPTLLGPDLLMILSAGVLAWIVGVWVRQPMTRLGIMVLCGVIFVVTLVWLFNRFGWVTAGFTPLLCFFVSGLSGLVGEYVVERAEKARVRGVLDRLVSKDIVRELLNNRKSYESLVRGTRRPVTVFFSDVRDFTTLSEAAADPQAFVSQLNEYLGEMVQIVFRHRGTVDKFIGDAVMAVWGSMHTEGPAEDAALALQAGLEMRERLAQLNQKWSVEGKQTLAFGMGINSGEVIVGGLGDENTKMEITVMGDAVNLASRLEGLTKTYKLDLLIGENAAKLVAGKFPLRTVDLVRVKGKKKPVEVKTLMNPAKDPATAGSGEFLTTFEGAIAHYRRREFIEAERLLLACQRLAPNDYLTSYYLELCGEFLIEAPGQDWDGVRLMTSK